MASDGNTIPDKKETQKKIYINPKYGFSLENLVYSLLKDEPFFAHFLLGCRVVYNHKNIPTAAASIRKGQITFYFNTDFMATYPLLFQRDVVKHEIFHILLDHCNKRGNRFGHLNHQLKNVAMDCAINQYIGLTSHLKNMPAPSPDDGEIFQGVTLEGLIKQTGLKLEPLQEWEYYYKAIMDDAKAKGNVSYIVDNHDMMENGEDGQDGGNPGEVDSAEDALNKAAVKNNAMKAAKAGAGNMSSALAKIMGSLGESRLPWKQILRNFVANSRDVKRIATRRRANRRFELDQPGYKKDKKLVLGVCVDESGSVSDESFASFMSEIFTISKNTSKTHIIYADCEVQHVETIKGGKPKKDKLSTRHGSGGTAYQPAIDKAMELGCDAILYFGDMDSADKPVNPKVPFMWIRVGKQNPPGDFGKVLDLD